MGVVLMVLQLSVTVIMGIYFYRQLRKEKKSEPAVKRSGKEMEKIARQRSVQLSQPLSETLRPSSFEEIIGQEEGIRALKAILCGKNPQHVIIYGPPGVGKTCAARLVLEYAKKTQDTPFLKNAPFIEVDATCVRFDERAIADPLLGSVHDPIYQGAGPLGVQGVPQPKPGAVSRAHGGVLFLDEIGELHPIQMNKLLKVLEDRKVRFDSAYYDPDDRSIPRYIHDIFQNGLPADFRLVGATTRPPESLPPALRSRCMEVFFRGLEADETACIAANTAKRAGVMMRDEEAKLIGGHAQGGRDAVSMVQMACGVAQLEGRNVISREDVEWVLESGHYSPRGGAPVLTLPRVGRVWALAVYGTHQGMVMPIEALALKGSGAVQVTGIVDEEEMGGEGHKSRRQSMARASAENVATVLKSMGLADDTRDLHINFPGGTPVDGPSAGLAMAVAAYSAMTGQRVDPASAVTGEIGLWGEILPVGGVTAKIEAACRAGLERVLIPKENWMERYRRFPLQVIGVESLQEALGYLLQDSPALLEADLQSPPQETVAARGMERLETKTTNRYNTSTILTGGTDFVQQEG